MKNIIALIVTIFTLFVITSPVFAADASDLEALAGDSDIAACSDSLVAAYADLGSIDDTSAVEDYYNNDFAAAYGDADAGVADVLANLDDKGYYLQHHYLAANSEAMGEKNGLNDAGDGSDWSAAHAECHPNLDTELTERDLYDIFIVNSDGNIVYTVFKETDLGTNLVDGSFADSGLGQAYQAASDSGELSISDVAPYWPSYEADAQFVCAPTGEAATICLQITPDQLADTGDIR